MSRELPYADSVHTFDSRKAETVALDDCRVALHGRSFPNKLTADFVERYPARRDGWLNIGVLHTSLDGTRGHDGYAPCGVEDLKRFGYDYWALGHVHAAEIVSRDPWIVYPGNLQGRSVRETGPKGAMRVSVDDGRIVEVTPLHLDGARWAHVVVDVSEATSEAEAVARVREALADSHAQGEGRPLAARVTLTGASPLHNHLVARREALQDELRACGFQLASDCWVEQLKIRTAPPAKPLLDAADALDVEALLAAAAADPEFAACVGELIESVTARLPADLQAALLESDALRRLAQDAPALLAGELS
jgi:DNA repair exonuclease SbcCD nuclease subunit